ncbi:MAG: hypothetical protein ACR2P1_16185 [Pseudomonadales bacterium]
MKTPLRLFVSALLGGQCMNAAAISVDVGMFDFSGRFSSYYADITSHVKAAGEAWNSHLQSDAKLNVFVTFTNIDTATGNSTASSYVGNIGSLQIFEQGAAAEVATGIDPNGAWPDIHINLGIDYLENDLWFDPDPYRRVAEVPDDKVDAASVLLHEFGHALAFNGWRDGTTGSLPGDYASTFDNMVVAEGNHLYFTVKGAMREYGDKVPLTFGNYGHLGNDNGLPGADLVSDLMNGVAFNYGDRAFISDLDIAILADTGVVASSPLDVSIGQAAERALLNAAAPAAVPLPAAAWLFASSLFGVMGLSRVRKNSNTL